MKNRHDAWNAGDSYERYMGRWSRDIAALFIDWLTPAPGLDWLEIGCGTGALTQAILDRTAPTSLLATDASADFVRHSAETIRDGRVRFEVADAAALPAAAGSIDIATSGLVFNFIPDRVAALREMARVLRPGGTIAFYVWDYPGGGMGFIDAFWRAAADIDPAAASLNEADRFPFCTEAGLAALCAEAGLADIAVAALEGETLFSDFEAFWHPFTLGAGPAPGYCRSLPPTERARLKDALAGIVGTGGPIRLPARAWAVRGTPPA
ncbi:class I SAM-dependent methyltransferase [Acuticoccus kandeliae]|uniref:class I SAM-dependent methyltransferase n=1 Tax=Acuticoccus kandeliae TaxID=2073160 RepID=UPI001FEC61A5|nr:class I SAM-dependent methyltransferase [Acuticoccus kandeliae]